MDKMKAFLVKYEIKLALAVGFILVASISFEAGYLEGKKHDTKPLVIEKMVELAKNEPEGVPGANLPAGEVAGAQASKVAPKLTEAQNIPANCAYVGSKNSTKFHLPNCSWAKRIKPENLVCYKTLEDATMLGKQADKGCIK